MRIKFAPSIMCSDYANLVSNVNEINRAGSSFIHADIMDGHYVPNLIVGPDYIKTLRKLTDIKLDFHLMVEKPENFIDMFEMQPGERVSFHPETTYHPISLLKQLKKKGLEVGIAIAPVTPISIIEDVLPDIDFIQFMTINPGFAGQPLLPQSINKLRKVRNILDENNSDIDIQVDGCVELDNILQLSKAGGNLFILGYPACFNDKVTVEQGIIQIKEKIQKSGYEIE